jgi:putative ABC transport system ATP-binding protein
MIRLQDVNMIHDPGGSGRFQSLHEVSLTIESGQVVVVEGKSGSGKTTLLSIIGALVRPTSGQVLVDGQPVAKLPDLHAAAFRNRTVGFVFQHYNLLDDLSAADNVSVPLVPRGLPARKQEAMVREALAAAGIEHRALQAVRHLSGGEKQRCAIARALVGNPRVLLCDEPTAHLDRDNTEAFLEIIAQVKDQGQTVVLATHDPVLTGAACVDRVVSLREGRIAGP